MKRVLVFSSLNLDKVYSVKEFVRPAETISALGFDINCGGKGLNLAVSFARAGTGVFFAGAIGKDGVVLKQTLDSEGIDTSLIKQSDLPNGHAVIQVDEKGQNNIIIVAGSNSEVDRAYIDDVLSGFGSEDLIVLQNEISNVDYIINQAHKRGIKIALNPSPFNEKICGFNLDYVDFLFVNEIEASQITKKDSIRDIVEKLKEEFKGRYVLLTLGENGSVCVCPDSTVINCCAVKTSVVDTTAAGDTFMGYFLSEKLRGKSDFDCMKTASEASSITVSRRGASKSIPRYSEL